MGPRGSFYSGHHPEMRSQEANTGSLEPLMSRSYHWSCDPEIRKPLPWLVQLLLNDHEDNGWTLDHGSRKVPPPSPWLYTQWEGPLPHTPVSFYLPILVKVPSIGRTYFASKTWLQENLKMTVYNTAVQESTWQKRLELMLRTKWPNLL